MAVRPLSVPQMTPEEFAAALKANGFRIVGAKDRRRSRSVPRRQVVGGPVENILRKGSASGAALQAWISSALSTTGSLLGSRAMRSASELTGQASAASR
jgi:hypothetical protein